MRWNGTSTHRLRPTLVGRGNALPKQQEDFTPDLGLPKTDSGTVAHNTSGNRTVALLSSRLP